MNRRWRATSVLSAALFEGSVHRSTWKRKLAGTSRRTCARRTRGRCAQVPSQVGVGTRDAECANTRIAANTQDQAPVTPRPTAACALLGRELATIGDLRGGPIRVLATLASFWWRKAAGLVACRAALCAASAARRSEAMGSPEAWILCWRRSRVGRTPHPAFPRPTVTET